MSKQSAISLSEIESRIYTIHDRKVMFDSDLANLYGVSTKRLNEQVKRNQDRFPPDFMFQLKYHEVANLKSQFATSSLSWGGQRKLPNVFTEHGTIMLANVLNSKTAVQASVQVVRAFIRLRELTITHKDLLQKVNAMEKKYDYQFKAVFDAIRRLMEPPKVDRKQIGFRN